MTSTESKLPIGEKFRRFWRSLVRQDSQRPAEPVVSPQFINGVFRPTSPTGSAASLSTRVLEFSREHRGKAEAPVFEGPLNAEYHCVASTLCEADQVADGDVDAVLLYCFIQANVRDVVFLWMKDSCEIYPSDRIKIISQQSASLLRINYPKLSDSGFYACIAANPEGRCETKSRLIVKPPALVSSSSEQPLISPTEKPGTPGSRASTPLSRQARGFSLQVSDNRRSKRHKGSAPLLSRDEEEFVANLVEGTEQGGADSVVPQTPIFSGKLNKKAPNSAPNTITIANRDSLFNCSPVSAVNSPEQSDLNSDSDSQDIRALPECDQPSPPDTIHKDQALTILPVSHTKLREIGSSSDDIERDTPTPSDAKKRGYKPSHSVLHDSRVPIRSKRPSSALGFTSTTPTREQKQERKKKEEDEEHTPSDDDDDDDHGPDYSESRSFDKRRQTRMFSSVRDRQAIHDRIAAFDVSQLKRRTGENNNIREPIPTTGEMHSSQTRVVQKSAGSSDNSKMTATTMKTSNAEQQHDPIRQQSFNSDSTRFATSSRYKTLNQQKMARLKSPKEKKLDGKTVHDSVVFMVQQGTSEDDLVPFRAQPDSEPEALILTPIQRTTIRSSSTSPTDNSPKYLSLQLANDSTTDSHLLITSLDNSLSPTESKSSMDKICADSVSVSTTTTTTDPTGSKNSEITIAAASDLSRQNSSDTISVSGSTSSHRKPTTPSSSEPKDWISRLVNFFQWRAPNLRNSNGPQSSTASSTVSSRSASVSDFGLAVRKISPQPKRLAPQFIGSSIEHQSENDLASKSKQSCQPDVKSNTLVSKIKRNSKPDAPVEFTSHPPDATLERQSTIKASAVEQHHKTSLQEDISVSEEDDTRSSIMSSTIVMEIKSNPAPDTVPNDENRKSDVHIDETYSIEKCTNIPVSEKGSLSDENTIVKGATQPTNLEQNLEPRTPINAPNRNSAPVADEQMFTAKSSAERERSTTPVQLEAGAKRPSDKSPKSIGIKSGFVKQTVQKIETHANQMQTVSPQMHIRSRTKQSLVNHKSASLPPPIPPTTAKPSSSQSARAGTITRSATKKWEHRDPLTDSASSRQKSNIANTGSKMERKRQNTVTRNSFVTAPDSGQNNSSEKSMENCKLELEFIPIDHQRIVKPLKQTDIDKDSMPKPVTTSGKGLQSMPKTKETAEPEHVTITKRPTLAPSLLHNNDKGIASTGPIVKPSPHGTSTSTTEIACSSTGSTSATSSLANDSATTVDLKRTSDSTRLDTGTTSTPVSSGDTNAGRTTENTSLPAVKTNDNNDNTVVRNDISATTTKSSTLLEPVTVTSVTDTTESLGSAAQLELQSSTLTVPLEPMVSERPSVRTEAVTEQQVEQTKTSTMLPTQLLPVAKLMQSFQEQTSSAATREDMRAAVLKQFKLGQFNDESDEDEDQRVEYPSKVKTIRDTDPTHHFEVIELLGRGKFGRVVVCKEISSGKLFASKTFRTTRLPRHNGELMEVAVLRAVGKHPQIAYMHAAYETKMQCTIVTELVSGGALYKRIQEEGTLDEAITVQIIRQVLLGLRHLQTCQVLHCDLKPENLVMRKPRGYALKIIDFGLACFYKPPQAPRPPAGTLTYLAPETQNYDPQSYATDLWSVAVIAYEILSGVTPFEIPYDGDPNRRLSSREISMNITKVRYTFDDEGIVDASREAKDFIKRILVRDPKQRPTVHECLEHAWIAMPDTKRSKVARTVSLKRHSSQRIPRNASIRTPIRASSLRNSKVVSKPESDVTVKTKVDSTTITKKL